MCSTYDNNTADGATISIPGTATTGVAFSNNNIGNVYSDQLNYDKAKKHYNVCLNWTLKV